MNNEIKDMDRYESLLKLVGVGLVCAAIHKLYLIAKHWSYQHPRYTALILTVLIAAIVFAAIGAFRYWLEAKKRENTIRDVFKKKKSSLYLGEDDLHHSVFVELDARKTHVQVVGSPGQGKTENGILTFAVDDMRQGRGFILIDGKPEDKILNKITSYANKMGRLSDLKVFSFADPNISSTFNPLIGDSSEQVASRVMAAFNFTDEYYKSLQQTVLSNTLRIFKGANVIPTFKGVFDAITRPEYLVNMAESGADEDLLHWAQSFKSQPSDERKKDVSGLIANISPYAIGEYSKLFNTDRPEIDIKKILVKNEIAYFQLPALSMPEFGMTTGKLILSCLANAVAHRHSTPEGDRKFFSVFLDDFSEYLYPGFLTILNKSRSADVGVVFAHQALGDIETMGPEIANGIKTNSSFKILMKCVDPDSAEYCARLIGTETDAKYTERSTRGFMGRTNTGESSMREAESFIYHPQVFRSELGVGEAVLQVPHKYGSSYTRVHFRKLPELPVVLLPKREFLPIVGFPDKYKIESGVAPAKVKAATEMESYNPGRSV